MIQSINPTNKSYNLPKRELKQGRSKNNKAEKENKNFQEILKKCLQ